MNGKTIKALKCRRCGYEWFPRTPKLPAHCANRKCNSPDWNKAKKQHGTSV